MAYIGSKLGGCIGAYGCYAWWCDVGCGIGVLMDNANGDGGFMGVYGC